MPSYLPEVARYVVPWARRKVLELAGKNPDVAVGDLWDEAVAALVRAAVYFDPETNRGAVTVRFADYAKTAVVRGLWRYALPNLADGQHRQRRRRVWVELTVAEAPHTQEDRWTDGQYHHVFPVGVLPTMPSAEEEYAAREVAWQRDPDGIAAGVWAQIPTPKASSGCPTAAAGVPIPRAPRPRTKPTPPPASGRRSGKAAIAPTPVSRRSN